MNSNQWTSRICGQWIHTAVLLRALSRTPPSVCPPDSLQAVRCTSGPYRKRCLMPESRCNNQSPISKACVGSIRYCSFALSVHTAHQITPYRFTFTRQIVIPISREWLQPLLLLVLACRIYCVHDCRSVFFVALVSADMSSVKFIIIPWLRGDYAEVERKNLLLLLMHSVHNASIVDNKDVYAFYLKMINATRIKRQKTYEFK